MERRLMLLVAAVLVAQIAAPLVESKSSPAPSSTQKPHIIVILADDLGWNDVSFHGSAQIPTPNIDALAYNGIILNQHYVPALCTPSRSSLMTGKYPTHTGMQHLVILAPEPWGLPLSEKLMPEYLKEAGYSTHAIGKWHLGFHRSEYTPTHRGFDSHFGYWNGYQDYYDHTMRATLVPYKGYDMRRNMSVDWESQGRYSTDLFTEEAVRIIEHHDPEGTPLFLYLSHLAPHAGNAEEPFQAPDEVVAKFAHIEDPERRIYAAMVSKMDESVGEVMAALRAKGMLQNSIVLFMSDNGGPTFGVHSNRGSNYPLKGMKESPWEGGVRGAAAIWSPLIKSNQRVSNQLMHIADWLPTFYTAAGMDVRNLGNIDGHNMWETLSENLESPRIEVLHNIDPIEDYAALRMGEWKYVTGTTQGGITDGWYGESGRENEDLHKEYDVSAILRSKAGIAVTGVITKLQVKAKNEALLENNESSGRKYHKSHLKLLTERTVTTLRHQAEVHCDKQPAETSNNGSTACRPLEAPCLFNIKDDPCEQINLAASRPLVLFTLEDRLAHFRRSMVVPRNVPGDPMANPIHWNGTWVNWKDEQPSRMEQVGISEPTSDLGTIGTIVLLVFLLGAVFLSIFFVALKSVLKGLPEKTSFFSNIFSTNSKSVDLHTKQPEEVK